jgi:hypothetical protein
MVHHMWQFSIWKFFAYFGQYWPSSEDKANTKKETLYMFEKFRLYEGDF